jgi:cell shape-determining protein MreC
LFQLIVRDHKNIIVFILLVIICISLIIGHKSSPNQTINTYLSFVVDTIKYPFTAFLEWTDKDNIQDKNCNELRKKYAILEKKYNALNNEFYKYEELKQKYQNCCVEQAKQKELYKSVTGEQKVLACKVHQYLVDYRNDLLNIDCGSFDGVEAGMPVLTILDANNTNNPKMDDGIPKRAIVGKVVQVGPFTSKVAPLSHYKSVISAQIIKIEEGTQDSPIKINYQTCVVEGINDNDNRKAIARYIDVGAEIIADENEEIEVYSRGGPCSNFPMNILIGTIKKDGTQKKSNLAPGQYQVKLAVNYNKLRNVLVIPNNNLSEVTPCDAVIPSAEE